MRPILSTLRRPETAATAHPSRQRHLSHTLALEYNHATRPRWPKSCSIHPRYRSASCIAQTAIIRPKTSASRVSTTSSVLAAAVPREARQKAVAAISVIRAADLPQTRVNLQAALVTLTLTIITAAMAILPEFMSGLRCWRANLVPPDPSITKSKSSSSCTIASSKSSPGQKSRTNSRDSSSYAVKMGLLACTIALEKVGVWNRSSETKLAVGTTLA
jgi:hypothetical protein